MAAPEATTTRVLFDATRLLARGGLATPTGIDRVDFAYVSALSSDPGFDLRLVTFDVFGPKLLGQGPAARLIEAVRQRWEASTATGKPQARFLQLQKWLETPPGSSAAVRPLAGTSSAGKAGSLESARSALDRPLSTLRLRGLLGAKNESPRVYVNTSHGRLFRKAVSRWLGNTGTGGIFFIHDLIPIEFPEFNRPREPERHAARLETVSAHASCVIVNSQSTKDALFHYLQARKRRIPPIAVLPLGIDQRFGRKPDNEPVAAAWPYFVMLSTIEPRKNHQLLLQIWRRLVETEGERAPRLVLIGRRGWENETIFNVLDRSALLSQHVVECSGLSDGDIINLLRGARAVLAPSFAEGYGLPVVEALALGTPVIASAIAAHREVGGECAEYLDPLDGMAWLQAIRDYAAAPSERREHQLQRLHLYKTPSWDTHLASALALIKQAANPA